jgi:hypothetical protein
MFSIPIYYYTIVIISIVTLLQSIPFIVNGKNSAAKSVHLRRLFTINVFKLTIY